MVSHDIVHKQPEHDAIANDVQRFLSNGGRIERLPPDASSEHGIGFNNRKLNYSRRGGFDYENED